MLLNILLFITLIILIILFLVINKLPKIHIYTVVTDPEKLELQYLIKSVQRFGDTITVIISSKPIGRIPIGFNEKIILMHKQIMEHKDDDIIMLVDGYDVLFIAPIEEIKKKYNEMNLGNKVLFSAEKYIWPDDVKYEHLKSSYKYKSIEKNTEETYCYLNSGIIIGTAKGWKQIIEPRLTELIYNPIDDQGFYTESYLKDDTNIVLDTKCTISQNLSQEQKDDVIFLPEKKRWFNKITNEYPCILHDNGSPDRINMINAIKLIGLDNYQEHYNYCSVKYFN